jgi:haloacetate dehalogenase
MQLPGFESASHSHKGAHIHFVRGGLRGGPPLLLLHGHPQTHVIWHKVAARLGQRFEIIASDLRGYGDSSKPEGLADSSNYSKREMALDQVSLMRSLGFAQFFLCAHDRGARVAHRLCADHPEAVKKAIFLDIAPTLAMYENTSMAFARAYWHWFFLIQPKPLPEHFLGQDPKGYVRRVMSRGPKGAALFAPEALAEYERCGALPGTIHAICEDYRASAGIDLDHDRADREAGRKLSTPLKVLWGKEGVIERCFQPLALWREVASVVEGHALPCGHYIPEEAPDALCAEIENFFV